MKKAKPIERSFLLGRDMGQAVSDEREETVSMLIAHGFKFAPLATRTTRSFEEFYTVRSALLAGGIHIKRLRGGRGIDG